MAVQLTRASSHRFRLASALVTGYPLTILADAYFDNLTTAGLEHEIGSVSDLGTNTNYLKVSGFSTDDSLYVTSRGGGSAVSAVQSGLSQATWHKIGAVWASATSRKAAVDGSITENTTSVTPSGLDETYIGTVQIASGYFNHFDGRLENVYFYNAALSNAELQTHARGAHPQDIRPNNILAAYWFVDATARDFSGKGKGMTANGTPAAATGSPSDLWMPTGGNLQVIPPVVGGDPEGGLVGGKLLRGGILMRGRLVG